MPFRAETGVAFASALPGIMHACGHDVHAAWAVGAAHLLAASPALGDAVILLQPAEETGRGALAMLEAGVLDGVAAVFGAHVDLRFPLGSVVADPGPIAASADEFAIEVVGRGGHAARPQEARDPVVAAAAIVVALQTIVARRLTPGEPAVVTVGTIAAGTAPNIIPERAQLSGTLRAVRAATRRRITLALTFAMGLAGVHGAIYTVTTTADSGAGSLRQAIINANANPGADQIHFNIAGTAPFTIAPACALPAITDPVVIDGKTQVGWVGTPVSELNGASAGVDSGLRLTTIGCTIRGIVINRFGLYGLVIDGGGSHLIVGNYIGTDVTGTLNRANVQEGIYIAGSSGNTIGGINAPDRIVISGNGDAGILILQSSGNVVRGNYIGTTANGLAALGNTQSGVAIYNSSGNLIGGAAVGARNLISANGNSGIYILNPASFLNQVHGNRIGAAADGNASLGNAGDGVTHCTVAGRPTRPSPSSAPPVSSWARRTCCGRCSACSWGRSRPKYARATGN